MYCSFAKEKTNDQKLLYIIDSILIEIFQGLDKLDLILSVRLNLDVCVLFFVFECIIYWGGHVLVMYCTYKYVMN